MFTKEMQWCLKRSTKLFIKEAQCCLKKKCKVVHKKCVVTIKQSFLADVGRPKVITWWGPLLNQGLIEE